MLASSHCVLHEVFCKDSKRFPHKAAFCTIKHIYSLFFIIFFILNTYVYAGYIATNVISRALYVCSFIEYFVMWECQYDDIKIVMQRVKTCCYWRPLTLPFQSVISLFWNFSDQTFCSSYIGLLTNVLSAVWWIFVFCFFPLLSFSVMKHAHNVQNEQPKNCSSCSFVVAFFFMRAFWSASIIL